MQSIQAIETAALEMPRRSSPFRALVWKEWRQQRWIFFSLAALSYVALAMALIVARSGRFEAGLKDTVATGLFAFAGFLGIVSVVVLSANAFSGERDDNTDLFLETIPCSRGKLFSVKLGFVLFLVLAELLPLAVAGLIYVALVPQAPLMKFLNDFESSIPVAAAAVLALATVPALIASFGGSVIATVLASTAVIAASWVGLGLALLLDRTLDVRFVSNEVMFPLTVALMLVTILFAAWRMWVRTERTWRRSLRTASATAGLLIAYVVVPLAAAYLYVMLFAPLSFFLDRKGHVTSAQVVTIAPDGKCVAFSTTYQGWNVHDGRAAMAEVDSGRTIWPTRFRDSAIWNGKYCWSPSGNQFIMGEQGQWLLPLRRERGTTVAYFVVDSRTGEQRSLAELCPGLPPMLLVIGWYNEHVLVLLDARGLFFADIESRQFRQCKTPAGSEYASLHSWWPSMTQRGVFIAIGGALAKGELHVLRYAPDLAEAERLTLTLTLRSVAGEQLGRTATSSDGQWLLFNTWTQNPVPGAPTNSRWCLSPLVNGAEVRRIPLAEPLGDWFGQFGFLPGSHQLLLYGGAGIGLLDADSNTLRRIPLRTPGDRTGNIELSPKGGFLLVQSGRSMTTSGGQYGEEVMCTIVDLRSAVSQTIHLPARMPAKQVRWLGEDRLLADAEGQMPWVMNRDGTEMRPLLK